MIEEEIVKNEINLNNIENSNYLSNSLINNYFNIYKRFKIYFSLSINNSEFIFEIKSDFFNINEQYIYKLIKNIVKIINNKKFIVKNNSNNYIISLKDCEEEKEIDFYIKNYEIKQYNNKISLSKIDLPTYSSNSLLKIISDEKINFVSKSPLNIMLIETYDDSNLKNNKKKDLFNNRIEKTENIEIFDINKKIKKKNVIKYKQGFCMSSCIIIWF